MHCFKVRASRMWQVRSEYVRICLCVMPAVTFSGWYNAVCCHWSCFSAWSWVRYPKFSIFVLFSSLLVLLFGMIKCTAVSIRLDCGAFVYICIRHDAQSFPIKFTSKPCYCGAGFQCRCLQYVGGYFLTCNNERFGSKFSFLSWELSIWCRWRFRPWKVCPIFSSFLFSYSCLVSFALQ